MDYLGSIWKSIHDYLETATLNAPYSVAFVIFDGAISPYKFQLPKLRIIPSHSYCLHVCGQMFTSCLQYNPADNLSDKLWNNQVR